MHLIFNCTGSLPQIQRGIDVHCCALNFRQDIHAVAAPMWLQYTVAAPLTRSGSGGLPMPGYAINPMSLYIEYVTCVVRGIGLRSSDGINVRAICMNIIYNKLIF